MKWISTRLAACSLLAMSWASLAYATPAIDTVRVDLNPLIDRAFRSPVQFAVNIPHAVSSATQGNWTRNGATSTWEYGVRIPTAVSMSFHATNVILPPGAVLTVRTAQTHSQYTARNVGRSGLWGRPMPGDTLSFSLSVNSAEASRVRLHIESVQAGYRSLGAGVADHPHYRALKKLSAGSSSGCTANYECYMTSANQNAALATVALTIENLYQCSGTLVNDVPGDGTPYVLTARHCESGQLGGGNPDAAATVSVYWDAITACGSTLGSIYSSGTPTQTGATTVLEQQDMWLIQLDAPPAAADAFYAGWDASGNPITGGYTIEHALGGDKQYVAWNGTDVMEQFSSTTLNVAYNSNFWGVVNSVGNLGAGASGSALFSPNNQLTGSASLAELPGGANTAGICPANAPATPSPSTVTALFTSLSGVWSSTADRTSSSGGKTMQSLLDPSATGQLTNSGLATTPLTITASTTFADSGSLVTLSWNAAGAQSCTAWGGTAGDGWAGPHAGSGSIQLTDLTGGTVNYALNCRAGNQIDEGVATVTWDYVAPVTNFSGSSVLELGSSTQFNWEANVSPCTASGGNAGDGWAGPQPVSGSYILTVGQLGVSNYTLTCGSGDWIAASTVAIDGVPPTISIVADVTQIGTGADFTISWGGVPPPGGNCTPSGGSATDNWVANNSFSGGDGYSIISEAAPGTYTYTITCTGGGQTKSASTSVVVTGGAPAISLTAVAPVQQIYVVGQYGNAPPNLVWTSNESNCVINYTANGGGSQAIVLSGGNPLGAVLDGETAPGSVTYQLECQDYGETASTTIDWVTTPTPSVLTVATASWASNLAYPVSWNSSTGPCVAAGGATGDGWAGAKAMAATQSVSESQPGTYVFTLTCGSGNSESTSTLAVTVPSPFLQVYSSEGYTAGEPGPQTSIVWSATVGPCTYVDGSAASPVGVTVPPIGSALPTPATAGTYLFTVTCGSGAAALSQTIFAQIPVFANVPTTISASATTVPVDTPVTVAWNSGGGLCTSLGGNGNLPWLGQLPASGSLIVTNSSPGAITYALNCAGLGAQVIVTYTAIPPTTANAPAPQVNLAVSNSTPSAGQGTQLTWTSQNANACSASGGLAGDGWSGSLALSGSMTVSDPSAGTVDYTITCTGAPPAASSTVSVVTANAAAPTGSGKGGGGAVDLLFVLGLMLPAALRARASFRATRSVNAVS
jgi:hypothetical protein